MKDEAAARHEGSGMLPATQTDPPQALSAEALFRAHAPFVASFLARMGVPALEIDDAVQEVFLVAHRKGGYQPGPAQPRSWLAAIAVHIAQADRRSRRRQQLESADALDGTSCRRPDPAARLETQRALELVQAALDALPLELRAAFVLFEIEGEPCESIAATWSVPVGTVYSRLHNARRRFLQAYAAHEKHERRAPGLGREPEVSR